MLPQDRAQEVILHPQPVHVMRGLDGALQRQVNAVSAGGDQDGIHSRLADIGARDDIADDCLASLCLQVLHDGGDVLAVHDGIDVKVQPEQVIDQLHIAGHAAIADDGTLAAGIRAQLYCSQDVIEADRDLGNRDVYAGTEKLCRAAAGQDDVIIRMEVCLRELHALLQIAGYDVKLQLREFP